MLMPVMCRILCVFLVCAGLPRGQTDTTVRPSPVRRATLLGLCGTNDGLSANDYFGPDGTTKFPSNRA
jgi:hypothetical protein